MNRVTGRYRKVVDNTEPVWAAEGIEYRQAPIKGAQIMAIDHTYGVILATGFKEIERFHPSRSGVPSKLHKSVMAQVKYHIEKDAQDADANDAYAERNHP